MCVDLQIKNTHKKWYWPIFIYLLDASISNSWQIFRHSKNQIPLLEFRREIALDLLQSGVAPKKDYKKRTVRDNLRYDGIDHFITKIQNRRRCQGCGKKTFYQCSKCEIALDVECFKDFHIK